MWIITEGAAIHTGCLKNQADWSFLCTHLHLPSTGVLNFASGYFCCSNQAMFESNLNYEEMDSYLSNGTYLFTVQQPIWYQKWVGERVEPEVDN
ncbi:hypothetical protein ACFX2I_001323 [Malus domestica]